MLVLPKDYGCLVRIVPYSHSIAIFFCGVVAWKATFLPLCSDQALVKGKQRFVDFIHIIISPFDKIFYNDIKFVRMG